MAKGSMEKRCRLAKPQRNAAIAALAVRLKENCTQRRQRRRTLDFVGETVDSELVDFMHANARQLRICKLKSALSITA